MQAFGFFFNWYNLPFLIALGCSAILMVVQIIGGSGDHDHDADVDVDADGDLFGDLLSVLGIGRVPLMIVVMALLMTFGLLGLLMNALVGTLFSFATYPTWLFLVVLLVVVVLTVPISGRLSRGIGALAPDNSTIITFEQLVGRMGVVVSTSVSPTYGRVQVRDNHGFIHTVFAISQNETIIPEHSEVALLNYDAARRCFTVQPMGRMHV